MNTIVSTQGASQMDRRPLSLMQACPNPKPKDAWNPCCAWQGTSVLTMHSHGRSSRQATKPATHLSESPESKINALQKVLQMNACSE